VLAFSIKAPPEILQAKAASYGAWLPNSTGPSRIVENDAPVTRAARPKARRHAEVH
jgi:hypothetical protein